MSAWFLGNAHINGLVEGGIRLGIIEPGEAQKTGRMLRRANIKSLNARYGDTRESLGVGPYYYNTPRQPLSDASLVKQAHCYNYQTCEYDSYWKSDARRFVVAIEKALPHITRDTPEYQEAPWGI